MKIEEYIKLGECAICPYSVKKKEKKLKCNWNDNKLEPCNKIKECGSFRKEIKIEISKLEI